MPLCFLPDSSEENTECAGLPRTDPSQEAVHPEEKTLMITHCNCLERAQSVKKMILDKIKVKDVVIMDTKGVSSMYANDGGIIVVM